MTEHTAREVVRLLKNSGYHEDRIAGDHHIFINQSGGMIPVPYTRLKDRISISTYKLILRELKEQNQSKS